MLLQVGTGGWVYFVDPSGLGLSNLQFSYNGGNYAAPGFSSLDGSDAPRWKVVVVSGDVMTAGWLGVSVQDGAGNWHVENCPVVYHVTDGDVTNVTGAVAGSVGSVAGNVAGNVAGSVGSVAGNVAGNVAGSVGSVAGNVAGNVGALTNAAVDNIFTRVRSVLAGYTLDEVLQIITSVLAGKSSGFPAGPGKMRDMLDTKDVVTSTLDGQGNRTAMVLNP